MKVRELIAYLMDCDQDADVMMDYGGTMTDIDGISKADGYITIE